MCSWKGFRLGAGRFSAVVVAGAIAWTAPSVAARGDVIYTGSGAGANASGLNPQYSQQQGTTPASATANVTATYEHNGIVLVPGSTPVTMAASALATPGAATLLQVHTSFSSPDPGSIVGAIRPADWVNANAWWNNVDATVQGPAGSPPPSSIRLEFQVNYGLPELMNQFGISSYTQPGQALLMNNYPMLLTDAGTPLQAGEPAVQWQNGSLSGTFHIDLPLSAAGVSQQFSLGVSSDLDLGRLLYHYPGTLNNTISVALKGIYLPDGTPIAAAGDNVTFTSGLTPPPPVPAPEPATLAGWCLLLACGGMILRRARSSE